MTLTSGLLELALSRPPDDLGHRIFWITLYLADCLTEG